MDGADTLVAAWGPAGVIIAALAGACVWLWRAYSSTQESRVSDAQKVASVLLDLQKQSNEVTIEQIQIMAAQSTAITELRAAINELRAEIRDVRGRRP